MDKTMNSNLQCTINSAKNESVFHMIYCWPLKEAQHILGLCIFCIYYFIIFIFQSDPTHFVVCQKCWLVLNIQGKWSGESQLEALLKCDVNMFLNSA